MSGFSLLLAIESSKLRGFDNIIIMIKKWLIPICTLFISLGLIFSIAEWLNIDKSWADAILIIAGVLLYAFRFGNLSDESLSFAKLVGMIYLAIIGVFLIETIVHGNIISLSSLFYVIVTVSIYSLIISIIAKYFGPDLPNEIAEKTAE